MLRPLAASLVLVLLVPSLALAQGDDGPPPEYRGIVDSALEEFDAQHWAEARALFERAHAIFPNARTLRGMGMAAFELRDYVAARRALESSLTDPRRALTAEQRAQVTELMTRARVFVGDFRIGPAPIGTVIDVDGAPATADGDLAAQASLPLAVGQHVVTLRATDGRISRAQITVHGGESAELALAIPSESTPVIEPEPTPEPAPTPTTPPPPPPPSSSPPAWAWGLAIGGGVLVIAGAVLLGVGASDAATVSNAARGTEWADLAGPYSRATPLEVSGGVALGIGIAAAVVGIVGLSLPTGEGTTVSVGPGSLLVRGTF